MLRFPKTLYGRFFVSLWAVTVLTIGGALGLTWLVMTERPESKPLDATAMFLAAAQTLDTAGEPGLVAWLRRLERDGSTTRVLVIGPDGRELLGRSLPPSVEYALKYPDGGISAVSPLPVLPSRPVPTLVGHDGPLRDLRAAGSSPLSAQFYVLAAGGPLARVSPRGAGDNGRQLPTDALHRRTRSCIGSCGTLVGGRRARYARDGQDTEPIGGISRARAGLRCNGDPNPGARANP